MVALVERLIGGSLLLANGVPVLVLEGARAVGKTTLMRNTMVAAGFSYTSLADPATRRFAMADLAGWLRRLPRPAIIDEAQLIPDLPLLLKEVVDTLGSGTHFVLTGSASIGRSGLNGSDPLTRRSRRFTMSPLTSWEISSQRGSLIDLLYEQIPVQHTRADLSDDALLDQMRLGGFPTYVFPDLIETHGQTSQRIRSDLTAVLSDDVLPGRGFDATIARTVLDNLLRTPGGIFNASRIAQSHDLDRRTIDRYLGLFERVFLVHWLANLATNPSRQSHTRAKIHPVDTSFSVESLVRAGTNLIEDRETFGALLESHVVNQILASTEWSETRPEAYFWRQASATSPEVDLVLIDGSNRVIGIEVKASRTIHPRDLTAMRALQQDRGLHRGFIYYTGNEVRQLADNIWALPISTLNDSTTFEEKPQTNSKVHMPTIPTETRSRDASMFLSYVHADNERSGGRIVKFARDLVDTYDYLYGHTIELFIDRDDIAWGQQWSSRLKSEAESTTFLLSIVTPRYLTSPACREEVVNFAAAATEAQEPKLLLPLQWVDIADTDVVAESDPVLTKIRQTQWESITEIRQIEPGSIQYDQLLERVAARLKQTIDNRTKGITDVSAITPMVPKDDRDLIELQQALESRKEDFEVAVMDFKNAFGDIGAVFQGKPALQVADTYGAAKVLADLGEELRGPVENLRTATETLGALWQGYDSDISRAALILSEIPDTTTRRSVFESLDSLANTLELPGADLMEQKLRSIGEVSRHLRPMSRAFSAALQLLNGIQASARAWRDRI
ncbi:DUF4143 domain-containing protein [Subtercola vilae]|uniref:DUF4143 domain-containing protein n=1 Tax=Subtercola vilae TaxID=2056433 RepID=A0A4T2BXU2_9MICO|nr:AAA family ATPase [Subtercola vilae]TIH36149.1 DUF4143 domain-containing protein [Subtercola vilae]